jgi:anti-sigma factor RsiW
MKMKCKEIHNKLIDYLDDELPVKEKEQVREHLSQCKQCWQIFQELKEAWSSLKDEKISYQPFFYTRLKQRMENKNERSASLAKYGKMILQPVMYFVILGLGIFIGIQLGQGIETSGEQVTQYGEEAYIESFADNQNLMSTQLDSIEQDMLKIEKTENNE